MMRVIIVPTVVYTSRLVAVERERGRVRASEREREREGSLFLFLNCIRRERERERASVRERERKSGGAFLTHVDFVVGFVNSANAMVPLLSFFTELIALRYYFCAFLLF
jgi:hypothetical protein